MTTRMMHPEHGWTHAYGEHEVEKLKALGWIVEGEREGDGDEHIALLKTPLEATFPILQRKPGRPAKVK